MATNCHDCGYRDTEVKSGGATSEKGRKITLQVEDTDDLSRDILKVRHPPRSPARAAHLPFFDRRATRPAFKSQKLTSS